MCRGCYCPRRLLAEQKRKEDRPRCLWRKRWCVSGLQMVAWDADLLKQARS